MAITKKYLEFLGIENPETAEEMAVEIAGLKTIIKSAEKLISEYEQALAIVELKKQEMQENENQNNLKKGE